MANGLLFDTGAWWQDLWQGMPAFEQDDLTAKYQITVNLHDLDALMKLGRLLGYNLTPDTPAVWFPKEEKTGYRQHYVTKAVVTPRYPVYIISKGRWESRLTSKALEKIGVPYRIVVEPQEFDNYAAVIDARKILTLPFSNLGQGSIPARNWVWEHSISEGAERHWILDDNIAGFVRLHLNKRTPCSTGAVFRVMEDFADRYENVALAGPTYRFLCGDPRNSRRPPFILNSRIYSCILIKNDIPYRWRGRYNEDTDLSIRALKDGWCTVLFYALLSNKAATMTMKGGNMEQLYQDDGRLKMAQSLADQHPDCVTVTEKWGRAQHHVDYSRFERNKLKLRSGVVIPSGVNDYGMFLQESNEAEEPDDIAS